jgi:hypothetical protein
VAKTAGFFVSDPVGFPSYNHQLTNIHTSMPQRHNIIPSGCAKSACLEHSAHPLTRSAHLERRKLLAFFASDPVGFPSYNHQLTNFHTSMPQRRIIIPSGCAECASPRHSAHPIARSAHLEMRTLLTFGCGRGPRASSDPVGSLSYNHQLTNFHNSLPQRRTIRPSGCAECAAPSTHLAHTLARSAHLERRKLLAFLCLTP